MNAKLNIWIRDNNCEILKDPVHLHVYNCRGTHIIEEPGKDLFWFGGGHVEVSVPPGCYLVTAGGWGGNFYTDIAMVVVRCGDDACVNLIRNGFLHKTPGGIEADVKPKANQQKALPLIMEGCAGRIVIPLVINAAKAGIKPEEIGRTLDVLCKAAGLDKSQVILAVQDEIKEMENHMEKNPLKDEAEIKEIRESMRLLKANLLTSHPGGDVKQT